jgi:hypothetical protein
MEMTKLQRAVFSMRSVPRCYKRDKLEVGSCCWFESKHLSANIKLIVYGALIRSIMTYACPTWEFAADTHLIKLQRLQNRVLRAIGKLDRSTLVCDLHLRFQNSLHV